MSADLPEMMRLLAGPRFRWVARAVAVLLVLVVALPAFAQDGSGYSADALRREGFVPLAPGEQGDAVSGGWLLVAAYVGMWTILMVWVGATVRRAQAAATALAEVNRRLQDVDDRLDEIEGTTAAPKA